VRKLALQQIRLNHFSSKPQKGNITTLPQGQGNITTLPQGQGNITTLPQGQGNITTLPQKHYHS
jgi:hypothetical protein